MVKKRANFRVHRLKFDPWWCSYLPGCTAVFPGLRFLICIMGYYLPVLCTRFLRGSKEAMYTRQIFSEKQDSKHAPPPPPHDHGTFIPLPGTLFPQVATASTVQMFASQRGLLSASCETAPSAVPLLVSLPTLFFLITCIIT